MSFLGKFVIFLAEEPVHVFQSLEEAVEVLLGDGDPVRPPVLPLLNQFSVTPTKVGISEIAEIT